MKKQVEPLSVSTRDGSIWIEQRFGNSDDDAGIILSPSQVPLLIEWLQEAQAENPPKR